MRVKGVIFDMDGLMFDTERLTYKIWSKVLNNPHYTLDFYKETVGKRSVEVKEMYRQKLGNDFDYDKVKEKAMEEFWHYAEAQGVPKKQGLTELLKFLKGNNMKVALATSTTFKSAQRILTIAKVREYFDVLVCGDMVPRGKPFPDIYAKACSELCLDKEECLALEDSSNGILSAVGAGIKTVMVPDLIEPTKEIGSMCYKVLDDLLQVKELVESVM